MARKKKPVLFRPKPSVEGVFTEEVEQCSTCLHWETPRRKRTCKADRKVKIDGKARRGTPHDYHCEEYTQLHVAKCGDCIHWTDERRPRSKAPCSKLSLVDDQGRARSVDSVYCRYFSQQEPFTVVDNYNLRANGQLVQIIDLDEHSKPVAFLLRQAPEAGLLALWKPTGPGEGTWEVVPVELTDVDEGDLEVKQFLDVENGKYHREVAFAGEATLVLGGGETESIGPQAVRKGRRGRGLTDNITRGLAAVRFAMKVVRKRAFEFIPDRDDEDDAPVKKAKRVQDEPWGTAWSDLCEQADVLVESSLSPAQAALSVQRSYFRQSNTHRLSVADGKRLQKQLMVYLRRKNDGEEA